MKRYAEIAKRSFKAKWKIYLFNKIINQEETEISERDFEIYELNDLIVNLYSNVYWQELETYQIKGLTIRNIYEQIENYESKLSKNIKILENKYIKEKFPQIMSIEGFEKLIDQESCYYCDITLGEIEKLGKQKKLRKKNLRGWVLEIDRLKPNYEYFKENCVMSCYWCNNAKTDEFSESEFKQIGKVIREIFRKRLETE